MLAAGALDLNAQVAIDEVAGLTEQAQAAPLDRNEKGCPRIAADPNGAGIQGKSHQTETSGHESFEDGSLKRSQFLQ